VGKLASRRNIRGKGLYPGFLPLHYNRRGSMLFPPSHQKSATGKSRPDPLISTICPICCRVPPPMFLTTRPESATSQGS
jgi:hypothetical protein